MIIMRLAILLASAAPAHALRVQASAGALVAGARDTLQLPLRQPGASSLAGRRDAMDAYDDAQLNGHARGRQTASSTASATARTSPATAHQPKYDVQNDTDFIRMASSHPPTTPDTPRSPGPGASNGSQDKQQQWSFGVNETTTHGAGVVDESDTRAGVHGAPQLSPRRKLQTSHKVSLPCPRGQFFQTIRQAGAAGMCALCPATGCGCKDPKASNFDANAQHADASCVYTSLCSTGWTCFVGTCAAQPCALSPQQQLNIQGKTMITMKIFQNQKTMNNSPTTLVNLGRSGCRSNKKCGMCQGDCDADTDCKTGLKCFQRNGRTVVHGCTPGGSGDTTSYDYCFSPLTVNNNGAAIFVASQTHTTVAISYTSFERNEANNGKKRKTPLVDNGGAIYAKKATVTISYTSFERNEAYRRGGAIYATTAHVTISYALFERNVAHTSSNSNGNGGAIQASGGTLTILYTSFGRNKAGGHNGRVSYGGAIYATVGVIVRISYASFESNTASKGGDHIYGGASGASHHIAKLIKIVRTTFTPLLDWNKSPGKSVNLGGAPMGCEHFPCSTGQKCTYREYSLSCSSCPKGLVGRDGQSCTQCPSGEQPNSNRTQCVKCSGATYSQFGAQCVSCTDVVDTHHITCTKCAPGEEPNSNRTQCVKCSGATYSQFGTHCLPCERGVVDPTKTTCTPCADGLQPNRPGTTCICMHGRFNRSKDTQCYETDYSAPAPFIRECVPCGQLNVVGSEECVQAQQCDDMDFHVRPGWLQLIREDGVRSSIFRCNHEKACLDNHCTPGSTGPLCGVCEKGYRRDSSGQCLACGAATWAGAAILALILILGVVALIMVNRWGPYFAKLQELAGYLNELEVKAVAKIFVATMQIVSAFANVLNLEMPFDFQSLLNLLAIFRFDVMSLVGLGCLMEESYANSLAVNICMVVAMMLLSLAVAAVQRSREPSESKLQQLFSALDTDGHGLTVDEIIDVVHTVNDAVQREQVQRMFADADSDGSERLSFDEFYAVYKQDSGLGKVLQQAQRNRSMNDSLGRLFLLVFLLYPGLTSKIFDIFLCRDLGPVGPGTTPRRVLHADYGVDCDETSSVRSGVGVLLVGIWPIGVPAALLISMLRYRQAIVAQDEDAVNMFQFVVADYKPEYWYWEVVELARKLLLSGLISILGRGTVAQAVMATMISFFFFALSVRALPFKSRALNIVKMVSEVQVFVVLLVCVVLQSKPNLETETITTDGYGVVQMVATLLILPIIVFLIVHNIKTRKADFNDLAHTHMDSAEENGMQHVDNPLERNADAAQED
eukprot:COSAG01_NODE_3349_length_6224_cov_19.144653_1_plen_1296_part_00